MTSARCDLRCDSGLTPTQAQVLVAVDAAPEGWMSVGDIARSLAVTQPTVSDAVAALERKGLVERARLEADRRVVCVHLTASGRRLARSEAAGPEVLLRAIGELDEVEQDGFLRALMKMIRSLQQAGRIPMSRMCVNCVYFRPHAHPGAARPHHCAYIDAPMRDSDLRLECAEQEPVSDDHARRLWQVFVSGKPMDERPERQAASLQGAKTSSDSRKGRLRRNEA